MCECGNTKIARATNVFYGGTKSCGCLFNEGNNLKHGDKGKRLYKIWKSMRERCTTPSQNRYKNYGGRGITICEEWDDYLVFKEWALSHGYRDDLTIDRIDYNGNYEPSNCRWADVITQANNRSSNHYITINGDKKSVSDWSRISGIHASTIIARLRRGWSPEDSVFKPLTNRKAE